MKLFVKIAALGLGGLLLVVGALYFSLEPLIAKAIREGGTYATGVETSVASVDLELLAGDFGLQGLRVANPEGFTEPFFLEVSSARVDADVGSLRSETIEIPLIAIDGVHIEIERTAGATNYDKILENLGRLSAGDEPSAQEPSEAPEPTRDEAPAGPKRRLVVRRIVLSDVRAGVRLDIAGVSAPPANLRVPEIVIEDFESDGTTTEVVGKLTAAVIEAVLASVVEVGDGVLPEDLLEDLSAGLEHDAAEHLKNAIDIFGGSGESKTEGRTVEDAKKTLEGIFGDG